jgi:hypothetical protein
MAHPCDRLLAAAQHMPNAISDAVKSFDCVLSEAQAQVEPIALSALLSLLDRLEGLQGHNTVRDEQNGERRKLRAVMTYIKCRLEHAEPTRNAIP